MEFLNDFNSFLFVVELFTDKLDLIYLLSDKTKNEIATVVFLGVAFFIQFSLIEISKSEPEKGKVTKEKILRFFKLQQSKKDDVPPSDSESLH